MLFFSFFICFSLLFWRILPLSHICIIGLWRYRLLTLPTYFRHDKFNGLVCSDFNFKLFVLLPSGESQPAGPEQVYYVCLLYIRTVDLEKTRMFTEQKRHSLVRATIYYSLMENNEVPFAYVFATKNILFYFTWMQYWYHYVGSECENIRTFIRFLLSTWRGDTNRFFRVSNINSLSYGWRG